MRPLSFKEDKMDNFLMICYVSAEFRGPEWRKFKVTPDKRGVFIEAPEWIKDTLLFKMLLKDGSIKVGVGAEEKKKLENDPMEKIGADGKELEEKVEVPDTKVLKTRKPKAKKDDAK